MAKAKVEARAVGLIVKQGGETREYELKQDSIILGSGPTANVIIDDASVASIHAIIKVTLEDVTIIDLGSETGTRVNGTEVGEARLTHGDRVQVGQVDVRVSLRGEEAHAPSEPLTDKTEVSPRKPRFDLAPEATKTELAPRPTIEAATQKPAPKARTKTPLPAKEPKRPSPATAPDELPTQPRVLPAAKKAPRATASKAQQQRTAAQATAPTDLLVRTSSVELPELGGQFLDAELYDSGIPKALLEARLPAAERVEKGEGVLQVALFWGLELLDVHHTSGREVCIGEAASNTFRIAVDGMPASMPFVRKDGTILVPDGIAIEARFGNTHFDRDDLRTKGRLKSFGGTSGIRLSGDERIAVRFGTLTLVVSPVLAAEQVRLPWLARVDQALMSASIFVALFALFLFAMAMVAPHDEVEAADDLFKSSQRFARLMLKDDAKKAKQSFELSGKKGGGKTKDEEGKPGKRERVQKEAATSVKGAPRVDPMQREKDRKVAMSSGLLRALSGKQSAVSNVFGPGGLGSGINTALGGLKGTASGDSAGLQGLGSRGAGPGAGGTSVGIGGIGNGKGVGNGGLGNVDLGGRGKSERSVEAGKTTVSGGLSQEAIKRVLDRAQSQLRYCYEKELQRVADLNGKVTVKFTISGSGAVSDASVGTSTLQNANAEECMLRVFRRLRFPSPAGGGVVDVSYPMIYKALGD